MPLKNLLKSLPKIKRSIKSRKIHKNNNIIKISKKFGQKYFDGSREYGYGGYYYHKGKNNCSPLMQYYESFGFIEDSRVNTELKCFSIVPFPSMIKML